MFLIPTNKTSSEIVATSIRKTFFNNGEMSTNEHKINIDPDHKFDNNDLKINPIYGACFYNLIMALVVY